jgi:hypothetical protein
MCDSDLSLCTMSTNDSGRAGKVTGFDSVLGTTRGLFQPFAPCVNNKNSRYHDPPEDTSSSTRRPMSRRYTRVGQSTSATAP